MVVSVSSYGHGRAIMHLLAFYSGLFFILASCEDEPVQREYPRVRTLEVTNISENGATFVAEIYDDGNVAITEHGFVWALSLPDIEYDNRILFGTFSGTGEFVADILTTLKEGVTYKVCAFAKAGEYTVYGNEVKFQSLGSQGPVISGFTPKTAWCGDTIFIRGKNFSWMHGGNVVALNNVAAMICSGVTDTTLSAIVPFGASGGENLISVEIAGNRTTFTEEALVVDLPEIISFTPAAAYWRDTVSVKLKNLRSGFPLTVKVGDKNAIITSPFDGIELKFIIPETVIHTEDPLSVSCQSFTMIAGVNLQLLPPVIDQFTPSHGTWSDVITIYGHFNPQLQGTSITIGGKQASILSVSKDSIKFSIPSTYYETTGTITYNFYSFSCVSPVSFLLDHPEVTTFTPANGYQGQTMKIRGIYFNASSSEVKFNSINASIISRSDSLIVCKIPGGLSNPVTISVTAGPITADAIEKFQILIPSITSFAPAAASTGDTITVSGKDFSHGTELYVQDLYQQLVPMTIVTVTDNTIQAIIPDCQFTSSYIYGRIFENDFSSSTILSILEPVILSLSPATATEGAVITITGANFSKVPSFNRIIFGYGQVTVINSTATELQFILPNLPNGANSFMFQTGAHVVTSPYTITVTGSQWERLPSVWFDYSIPVRVCMPFEHETYVLNSYYSSPNPNLFRFDPTTNTFEGVATYYLDYFDFSSSVIIDRNAYFFSGFNPPKLMRFNADDKTITVDSDFPGSLTSNILLLNGDSVLYAGGGRQLGGNTTYLRDFYKYNYSTGIWTRLNNLPGYSTNSNEFTINGKCYIQTSDNALYEYNPVNDSWIRKADPPDPFFLGRLSVVCSGKAYVGYGASDYNQISYYDPLIDKWTPLVNPIPRGREHPFAFAWNEEIYLGGGYDYSWFDDFWKYSPVGDKK